MSTPDSALSGLKVFVVEDEAIIAMMLEDMSEEKIAELNIPTGAAAGPPQPTPPHPTPH